MRPPSTRIRKTLLRGSGPVAVLLAGVMVWQGSDAAFTAETYNAGNNWAAGSVAISNDGTGGAMFSLNNVTPSATGSHCIVVTTDADVAGTVKTYLQNNISDGLQNNITMKIEMGTGGSYSDCTGFTATATEDTQTMASLFASHSTYGNGILPWVPPGDSATHSRTYKFTWTFDTTDLTEAQINDLMGKSVRTDIEWEIQNN
jgi:hypothetical protein